MSDDERRELARQIEVSKRFIKRLQNIVIGMGASGFIAVVTAAWLISGALSSGVQKNIEQDDKLNRILDVMVMQVDINDSNTKFKSMQETKNQNYDILFNKFINDNLKVDMTTRGEGEPEAVKPSSMFIELEHKDKVLELVQETKNNS